MTNSTKNYSTDGGDTLVVGGKLIVEAGATVEGIGGGSGSTAWGDITGKPATFAPTIGTTAMTAMAGNTAIPPVYTLPAAGTAIGGVKKGAAVPNAVEGGELATLNALLASLRTAGVIA